MERERVGHGMSLHGSRGVCCRYPVIIITQILGYLIRAIVDLVFLFPLALKKLEVQIAMVFDPYQPF